MKLSLSYLQKSAYGSMPFAETRSRSSFPESRVAFPRYNQARFKRRATAVPNSIDRIKFDFSTAVARRLKPSRAIAV